MAQPERYEIAPGLNIARALTGLWQVADIERKQGKLDPEAGADVLQRYVDAGFDTFDMADHYGSAEIITGALLRRTGTGSPKPLAFTKWCPPPGPMSAEIVRKGVQERLDRLGVERVDLLQFHWWSFQHPAWLDALHELTALREEGLIREIGVTNFDAAHLALALADGIALRTNQVSFSLVDRRAAGPLAELCATSPVRLLAYGTLCGGFLSERWLDAPEPDQITDWSKMKYKRFIDAAGGWKAFQTILSAASAIARKHGVSIANVATRWVLEQRAVAGVIIGARLGENIHTEDNAQLFAYELDREDHDRLEIAFAQTRPIPGDCGDEYRKPPFLTATGDLSDHLDQIPLSYESVPVPYRLGAERVLSGSKWEDIAGYCRAQRVGDRILVSGTTATAGSDRVVAPDDAGAQTTFILDKIAEALAAFGAGPKDVIRTRIYLVDEADTLHVSNAHGRVFGEIKPANTLVVVAKLVGGYRVEIEAEALVAPDAGSANGPMG
ncbi:aldo/keto reductase [Roseobacter fucihabitans]|uniref:aldo/keto reductase n=1 Tax=Roseobacter fucihabitans TaxID=1537242 RepID=UPI001CA30F13|nr:aldo/keto reductase [Roseobacter litoralis]